MASFHSEDIREEPLLVKKWIINEYDTRALPPGILVTGPNSFIGCHVVQRLKKMWPGPVHLLIRAPSRAEAIQKMDLSFRQWGIGEYEPGQDVIHLGDVLEKNMGLPGPEFRQLGKQTGWVVHLAMTPLYHLPYHHFKRLWIPELEQMISFCADKQSPKSLHYASSFNANFFQVESDFAALNTNAWQSGYAGFKWVAGRTLLSAVEQNLHGCIYDIPLVLGTEASGSCPSHYSIWHILDIFLKTGMFFPFSFNVIPVDILSDIIVFNMLEERLGRGSGFVRPLLDEPVTDRLFSRTASNLLGLQKADIQSVKAAYLNKLRFDFMMPGNFYELMERVIHLEPVLPPGYDMSALPPTPVIFMSNLNSILARKNEQIVH